MSNDFHVTSPDDPILEAEPCAGIAEFMRMPHGQEKARLGAELFDRLLSGPGLDRRFAQVRRTVFGHTNISHLIARYQLTGQQMTPEQIEYVHQQVFRVEPYVEMKGRAGVGNSTAPRYGVRVHLRWPFENLTIPHDGSSPVIEFYAWDEVPLAALTAAERLDTAARLVREQRAHLAWVYQRHPDSASVQAACFDGAHSIYIKGERYAVTIWDAIQPFIPPAGNPLVPTVGRSLKSQAFEDLFSHGTDWNIVRNLTLAFDESRTPDIVGYVQRYFRKRRIDASRRKATGRDPRLVLSDSMDNQPSEERLRKWLVEERQPTSQWSEPGPLDLTQLRPQPSAGPDKSTPGAGHTAEQNDQWELGRQSDVAGWASRVAPHRQAGQPLDSVSGAMADRLHWKRRKEEYRATLPPAKAVILDLLVDDPEATWRDARAALMRSGLPTDGVSDRTLRYWLEEIRKEIDTFGNA